MIHTIAHRGNTKGKTNKENLPLYVENASIQHYVEVDVWYVSGKFFLGHDTPQYHISIDFLKNEKLFCHAKNIEALHAMLKEPDIHCFWHEEDLVALTSKGFVWKYPEVYYEGKLWGVCSDWVDN
jgi:hypothetical protein